MSGDHATARAMQLERALHLGRRLRVEVAIDESGRMRNEIELVIDRQVDGSLRPLKVRIGSATSDDAVLAKGGVLAGCAEYNAAIARLRELADRLARLIRQGRVQLAADSALQYAHRVLSQLDALIARRQSATMGHAGTVRLATLRREIEFFARCDAQLQPIVIAAERTPHGTSRAQKRWPWLSWGRARRAAAPSSHDLRPSLPRSTT